MPITSDQQYQEAQSVFASGTAKDMPRLRAAILEYENKAGISDEQPQEQAPPPPQEAPKAGPQGFWMPQRPLNTRDYIPEDVGGGLAVHREVPYEAFKQGQLGPALQSAVAQGQQAQMEIERMGPQAFAPEEFAKRVQAIAMGKKAEMLSGAEPIDTQEQADHVKSVIAIPGTDPIQLARLQAGLEVWEQYKQFNEANWQQAVQKRQQDPNAGPIQRLEKLDTSTWAGKIASGTESIKEHAKAAGQGALSAMTLGTSREMPESLAEGGNYATAAMSPPGLLSATGQKMPPVPARDEAWHNRPLSMPISHGLGSAVGTMLPGSASGTLAKTAFAAAAPKLGRYGGAALAGGATTAAEGGAGDFMSGETEGLAGRTALRAGLGAGAGALGQGVADLARGASNKISESAIRSPQARTPYEFTESQGWTYDPILGPRPPRGVDAQRALTRETGVPWAERFADKAEGPVVAGADLRHVAEKAAMKQENLSYFASVRGQRPTPITNLNRAASELMTELEGANPALQARVSRLVRGFSPVMTPQKMGTAMEALSGEVERATDGATVKALGRLQSALMEDMKNLPKGSLRGTLAEGPNGETLEGWPALRQEHGDRTTAVDQFRQHLDLTKEGAKLPYDVGGVRHNLMKQGTRDFPVAKEKVLDRFMPPELQQESLMLRAANMVQDIETGNVAPYPSQAGVINWVAGKVVPRAYGLGRAVSRPPDNFPISDKMFQFVNSRIPRATLFVPGMDIQQLVQERIAMEGRPKTFKDLTPEQQQMLLELVSSPEEQRAPQ